MAYAIYRDILIPMMQAAGFQLDFDDSSETRYHTRLIWRRSYVETDVSSEYYGQTQSFDWKVDVCGIPIGSSVLLLHGIVVGSQLADECDDVKTQIRYSLNSQSSVDEPELAEECREPICLQLQNAFVTKLIELFSLRLDHLPFEVKLKVLSYLPAPDIAAMSQVSTLWRQLTLDEQLWRLMVQSYFPDSFTKREKDQSWKALFKDEFARKRLQEKRRPSAQQPFPPHPLPLPIMPHPYFPRPLDPLRDLFPPIAGFPDDEDIMNGPGFPDARPNPYYFG